MILWVGLKFHNVPEKLDPFLRNKLWADDEMSGMLNWALEGLYEILEKGEFNYNKTSDEIKTMMVIVAMKMAVEKHLGIGEEKEKLNLHPLKEKENKLIIMLWKVIIPNKKNFIK